VIFGNSTVIIKDILGKTLKPFNAVDMIFAAIGKNFRMIQAMMFASTLQRLLFSTGLVPTPYISSTRSVDLKRTAENTLSASQKVGRTAENVLFACNQRVF
jgi:hypothetical protein